MVKKKLVGLFVVAVFLFLMGMNVFAATVGQALTAPEAGWKRCDIIPSGTNVSFTGNWWDNGTTATAYGGSVSVTASGAIKFSFTGTGFRILATTGPSDRHTNNRVIIDGVTETFTEYSTNWLDQCLVYQKLGLQSGKHTCEIIAGTSNSNMTIDAFDIGSNDTLSPLLIKPTNLSAISGDKNVRLEWSGVEGDGVIYKIKRSIAAAGPYTTVTTTSAISFVDNTVVNTITYYYVVSAINSFGESKNSNEVSATPIALELPVAPTSLTATAGNTKVDLSWNATSGSAITYNVKRSTTAGGIYTTIATTSAITFTDSTVTNGTTYYYVVSATDANGEGSNSNEVTATPIAPASTSGNKAILEITMTNGTEKEYDFTATELQDFLAWYDSRSGGAAKAYYTFIKKNNIKPFLSRKEYIAFDKILSFEVKDYNE